MEPQQQQDDYPCCVTPKFTNGLSTAPLLFEIAANKVSQLIKTKKNIEKLDIPKICKKEVRSQFNKNKYI